MIRTLLLRIKEQIRITMICHNSARKAYSAINGCIQCNSIALITLYAVKEHT